MPIFEYRCANCNEIFEYLRLSRSDNHMECPHCGGQEATQMFSVFAAPTRGRSNAGAEDCFNRSAGICAAGGGPMT